MLLHTRENQKNVDAFQEKNEKRLELFYAEQWPSVLALIGKMGVSEDEASDIMQNTFMLLFDKVRSGKYENREGASIGTYFQRMCRYLMLNVRKSAHRTRVSSIDKLETGPFGFEEE